MAGSLNKVLLIGRLGADPDIKQMVKDIEDESLNRDGMDQNDKDK